MSKISIADAIEILHPDTTAKKLSEIEYYHGFRGKEEKMEAVNQACLIACDAMQTRIKISPTRERICERTTYRCLCGKDLYTRWRFGGALGEMSKYCKDCGQAIDWSELNGVAAANRDKGETEAISSEL